MENKNLFSIRYSPNVLVATISLATAAVALGAESVKAGVANVGLILPALSIAIYLVVSFYYSVRGLEITESELIVHHPIKKLIIPLRQITAVEEKNIRLHKMAPLFGYYGRLKNNELGTFRSLVTHPKDAVMIKTYKNTYLVSPKDKTHFTNCLQKN